MTTAGKKQDDDQDLKPNEPQRQSQQVARADQRGDAKQGDWSPPEGTPPDDPKQNEDLGIPGGYTEAQKEKLRASRTPQPPPAPEITPEQEEERIKRNTQAATEHRNAELGPAPKVKGDVGKMEAKGGIPSLEMQEQISAKMDAELRKETEKQNKEKEQQLKELEKQQEKAAREQEEALDKADRKREEERKGGGR